MSFLQIQTTPFKNDLELAVDCIDDQKKNISEELDLETESVPLPSFFFYFFLVEMNESKTKLLYQHSTTTAILNST